MGLLTKLSLFLLLCGIALNTGGSVTQAQVPNRGVQRLESMAREMSKRTLTDQDRTTMVAEIARAAIYSARSGREENALLPGSQLENWLTVNFPDILERKHERGLFLTDMLRYFHGNTRYRPIIDAVLREAKANGTCNK